MADPRKTFVCRVCGLRLNDIDRPWGSLSVCPRCGYQNGPMDFWEKWKNEKEWKPMDENYALNRKLYEAFGYCWHKWSYSTIDGKNVYRCVKCGYEIIDPPYNSVTQSLPNYVADPRLVLREMREREDYFNFITHLPPEKCAVITKDDVYWSADLIFSDNGKLAQLALNWLERGGNV